MPNSLYLFHLSSTLYMTGLIWFVQIVHYPLFARVGSSEFSKYEEAHTRRTSLVVGPPMLIEFATGWVLLFQRPAFVPYWVPLAGLLMSLAIWVSTALIQVPKHRALASGFDSAMQRSLVRGNWLRTALWSLRSVLLIYWCQC